MSQSGLPKVLIFAEMNSFGLYDNGISIHLGQLSSIAYPMIPKLYPTGFMINVMVDGNNVPVLTNTGEFPIVIYDTVSSNELKTSVVLTKESVELELDVYLHFTINVFDTNLSPRLMAISLKVQKVVNTDGYDYALYINPSLSK